MKGVFRLSTQGNDEYRIRALRLQSKKDNVLLHWDDGCWYLLNVSSRTRNGDLDETQDICSRSWLKDYTSKFPPKIQNNRLRDTESNRLKIKSCKEVKFLNGLVFLSRPLDLKKYCVDALYRISKFNGNILLSGFVPRGWGAVWGGGGWGVDIDSL